MKLDKNHVQWQEVVLTVLNLNLWVLLPEW